MAAIFISRQVNHNKYLDMEVILSEALTKQPTLAELNMASAFGSPAVPSGVAAVILTYFAVTGFLGAYLWTRIFLSLEFTRADRAGRQSPAFYEGLVEALLYQPAPDGFEAAIRNGEEFIRRFGQGNWRIWRSLACAWGQKYSYLMFQEPRNEIEMSRTRQQALDAVRRIININPDERDGIRSLWEPKRTTPEENDLKVFASDEEFRSLLVPSEDESRTGDMAENKT
jgi:hypothetical protein